MSRQQFNKDNLRILRDAMQAALDQVSELCEVSFEVGSCQYSPQNCTFRVKIANVVDGEVKKQEVEDWNSYAKSYGFKKEDLGREFTSRGHKCRITGLLPNRRKYPVQYLDLVTQKKFVTTAKQARQSLGIEYHEMAQWD